ncbi:hypothetical protein ACC696_37915, partial [Rhizobium ruizarguesonis]
EFPEVMGEFEEDFRCATMIAHNAAFDFSVWRSSLDLYRQSYPELTYLCSLKMAQRIWPHFLSHRLNLIAAAAQTTASSAALWCTKRRPR